MVKEIKTYQQALDYIYSTIPHGTKRFPGEIGIKRQKQLLKYLGEPQNKVKIIHVAGTSGKGSVVSYLSALLTGHGFKVGTTMSPHLKDIRERIQINQKNISKNEFVDLTNEVALAVKKIDKEILGEATFFEILLAMAFLCFYKNKVDYAVVETGMGGLFDGSNTINNDNKIAVITRLGLDHTSILGKKLSDIAFQKAGIINQNNTAIVLWQLKNARMVIENESQKRNGKITYVRKGDNFGNVKFNKSGISYTFKSKDFKINLHLNSLALYQVENSSLAMAAFLKLSQRDGFSIKSNLVQKIFGDFKINGRMEIIEIDNKKLILDGAHNPQKMKGFIDSLKSSFPNKKFTFIIAFKQRKDFSQMIKMMLPLTSKFIFTSFVVKDEDMVQISQPTKDLIKVLDKTNFQNYRVILSPKMALKTAFKESDDIVITSSLYLLKKMYPYLNGKELVQNYNVLNRNMSTSSNLVER